MELNQECYNQCLQPKRLSVQQNPLVRESMGYVPERLSVKFPNKPRHSIAKEITPFEQLKVEEISPHEIVYTDVDVFPEPTNVSFIFKKRKVNSNRKKAKVKSKRKKAKAKSNRR